MTTPSVSGAGGPLVDVQEKKLRKAATDGQVLLLLDPEGMKQSAVFLEFCFKGGRRHFG